MIWIKGLSKAACAVIMYFSIQGLFAVFHEVYHIHPTWRTILLFPAAKIIGDVATLIVQRGRRHAFWEEWLAETGRFSLLSVVALISLEFWKNFLSLSSPIDLTVVVIIAYLLMSSMPKGGRTSAYELS